MYDIHLGLIGKHVVDILLVFIKLLSLGVMAKALRAKIDRELAYCKRVGQYVANVHAEEDDHHQ